MFESTMEKINAIIRSGSTSGMSEREFFQLEIERWKNSEERQNQIIGEKYYRGKHDILDRVRTVIGEGGNLQEVRNLPNNLIVDNQYAKTVDQKTNYLLGKPFTLQAENKQYKMALSNIFNMRFFLMFQNLGEDSLNGGIGWIHVFYDNDGAFRFKRFAPYEILPFWKDSEHTILDCVVRVYEVEAYEGKELKIIEKVEIYKVTGVERYVLVEGNLLDDTETLSSDYMVLKNADGAAIGYNWGRVPIIAFKYNDEEVPLISKVKSLQDAINMTLSDFQNNMQEDSRSSIIILKNHDGTDLGEFRRNLAAYGVIKVRTTEGIDGGVDSLQITVNSENYRVLLELLKKALIENAMGYDAKDDRLSGSPNQMNIQSMYNDIELDANGMEAEYQASFEDLLWFVNKHLANNKMGNFEGEELTVIFNRDMLMNEVDIINNIKNSVGILSKETLIAQHPWVNDVVAELKRLEKEQQQSDIYAGTFQELKEGETDDDTQES